MGEHRPQQDDKLDGYRLIRLLGAGGFGQVWLCRSEAVGDLHALKFIEEGGSELIEREFDALVLYRQTVARVGSPHLVPIEHINRNDSGLYYIMPLADGTTSEDPTSPSWKPHTLAECIRLKAAGTTWFSAEEIVAMFVPILGALQILSDAGLVHRDVKPDNILFLGGRPCLGDISLLRTDSNTVTRIGTHGYTAPSWYGGGHVDMYGAAATLYSLITGNPPDCLSRSAFLWPKQEESMIAECDRHHWAKFHAIIRRAMEQKVQERYPNFDAMARAILETLNSGASVPAPPSPIIAPASHASGREAPPLPQAQSPQTAIGQKPKTGFSMVVYLSGAMGLLIVGLLVLIAFGSMGQNDQPVSQPVSQPVHQPGKAQPAAANSAIRFEPPKVQRSPRDHRKGNSISEDSRLAYNSLSWFLGQNSLLTANERNKLGEILARIDVAINDPESPDLKSAARLVDSAMASVPAVRRSTNAKLAKLLFLYLDGDHDTAREFESDPSLRILGSDELGYRVELMGRLRMDPRSFLTQIIASPNSEIRVMVPALMERARLYGAYGNHAGGRQDVLSALKLSAADPQMRNWVEQELEDLKRTDGRFARELQGLQK